MKQTPSYPPRRNLRVPDFDYSQPGAFFVTIVTQDRKTLFGQIVDGDVILNEVSKIVEEVWIEIPKHFPNVELGEFVIMPNHIHGIISIVLKATHAVPAQNETVVEATHASPLPRVSNGPLPGSIGAIIGSFKSAATKRFHEILDKPEKRLWQRGYYEHVIRNERGYTAIYEYILANPMNWEKDEENSNL
jgi:REP element-mobilizing transposase RayT